MSRSGDGVTSPVPAGRTFRAVVVPQPPTARLTCRPIEERPPPTAAPSLEEPSLEHTRPFADELGFFRTKPDGNERRDPLASFEVEPGPPWTTEEAQAQTRRFLDVLADGRPIAEEHPDPLEYAQRNGLLLLIGPAEEKHLVRIAAAHAARHGDRLA